MAGFDEAFRTVVISKPAKISLKNNNLCIDNEDGVAMLLLKDILCIVLESQQVTITSALISKLADAKVVLLSCDDSHNPNGIFFSYLGHYQSSGVIRYQIDLSKHTKAILWQKIIKQKVQNQAKLLAQKDINTAKKLIYLSKTVKLGDATYVESNAAAIYFPSLFYKGFVRDDLCGINSALNYGYSIVRATITRALAISGLNPNLGIKHDNAYNPFNLADDIIEPYRPFVDKVVYKMHNENLLDDFLNKENKHDLLSILSQKTIIDNKSYPISRAISKTIQSLTACIKGESKELKLPIFGEEYGEIYESDCDV
ncbi:MAG: type II CRISPR-associated endonuclease Cas1 [Campylobacter sp.]|nr:type II CRISPR-associated endonuclease Cas1 [Campylobacter sp.]